MNSYRDLAATREDRLIGALVHALEPFSKITWDHTVWSGKDDDTYVLQDHESGAIVTLGDFKRAERLVKELSAYLPPKEANHD